MYTKLFKKILTSSVWTYDHATRVVWVTLLADMDEDGFAQFATIKNLAAIANVSVEEASTAVKILEAPDPDSSNQVNDGRRLERVPGGWMVLNAPAYRELQRRTDSRAANAERVRRYRERGGGNQNGWTATRVRILERDGHACRYCGSPANCVDHVMPLIQGGLTVDDNLVTACKSCNARKAGRTPEQAGMSLTRAHHVTPVTVYTDTEADTDTKTEATAERSVLARSSDHAETGGSPTGDRKYEEAFRTFWAVYPRKTAKATAAKAYAALRPSAELQATMLAAVRQQAASHDWQKDGGRFVPHAATWLRGRRWEDVPVGMVPASTASADPSAPVESAEDREHRLLQERTQVYIAEQKRLEAETKAWRESPDYVPLRELFRRQREAQGLPPLAFLDEAKP